MVQTTQKTYLLVGNYGADNLGDEALKDYFLTVFKEINWRVVSADPKGNELARLPAGLRSFITFKWLKTVRVLRQSQGIVFGGGTLFADTESVGAIIIWWLHAFAAWLSKKNIILAFQGIGPIKSNVGEYLTKWVIKRAGFISVRDEESYQRIKDWPHKAKAIQTFDPVFAVMNQELCHLKPSECHPEHGQRVEQGKSMFHAPAGSNLTHSLTLTLIPRHNSGEKFIKKCLEKITKKQFTEIKILSLQPDSYQEQNVCKLLAEKIQRPITVFEINNVSDLIKQVQDSDFIITQRYHGALAALATGVEYLTVKQREGDKLHKIKIDRNTLPIINTAKSKLCEYLILY